MNNIQGKVIAITGASSGIGRATAILLAEKGAKVVLGARRLDRLESLVNSINSKNGEAVHIVTDVRKFEDVSCLVNLTCDKYGKLDVMINNAGIARIAPFDDLLVKDWEDMIDVNLKGVLYGIAAALPVFRKQGFGHFINTISTSGLKIVPNQGVYAATKNAVRTIAECLRQEAGDKLRITNISPGYVQTELADYIPDAEVNKIVKANMAEMGISPDVIARSIAFAIEQPDNVDVGDIIIRPTSQS